MTENEKPENPNSAEHILHINNLQERVLNANCKEMYVAVARGSGKTDLLGKYEANNMQTMPRCMRLLLNPSYRKTVTDLLPGVIISWEAMGYKRDIDFVVGNSDIPKKKKWPEPYYVPEAQYRQFLIHWRSGASLRIGSADRKVTLNGLNLDGITVDEAKLVPETIFNETLKTNRANPNRSWSDLPQHNSIVCFTDKYWNRKNADWIMKKKKLADKPALKNIYILQTQLNAMAYATADGVSYSNPDLAIRIIKLLNKIRNETVAFFEAAAYVNIPAISPSFILQMKRNMGENEFRTSMLNHDIIRSDSKEYFYPLLSEDVHGYIADNFGKLDNLEFDFASLGRTDCTFDTDCDRELPLEISVDWGGNINTLVVFQEKGNSENAINSFFAKHPEGIKELAKKFSDYYRPHPLKRIKLDYDPSGNNKVANGPETLAEEFVRYLRNYGWEVEMMHLGVHNNPRYQVRYDLFKMILQHGRMHDPKFPYLWINKNNCKEVFISMLDAGLKKWEKKLKKDKSSEKPNSGILPEHATNFSDCVDYHMMRKYGHLLSDTIAIPSTLGEM